MPHAQAPRPDGPSSWTANINHDEKIGSHLAAMRPALIFSWIEAPDPFQTKIFFPESSTNTSPWFIDDHAMSTWRGNNSEFTPSLQCLRLRKKSLQCHLSHNRSRTASNLEKLCLVGVRLSLGQTGLHATLLDHDPVWELILEARLEIRE